MKLAIYDFDGTYVSKQTLPILYQLWKEKKLNPKVRNKIWRHVVIRYILYKLKLFGWTKRKFNPYSMKKTMNLFQSVSRDELSQFLDDYHQYLQKYIPIRMKNQLIKDKEDGYFTILLSGNLDIILEPFKKDGFDAIHGSKATKNQELLQPDDIEIYIEDKKRDVILKKYPEADLSQSKAYADNGYDIALMEIVSHPVAVNPDKELEKHAIKHNWKIIKNDN